MIIAFDVFGTVFDLSGVPREEVRSYVAHVRADTWSPLNLPASWENLPPHPDAVEGIAMLRRHHTVVTLSNGPMYLLAHISKRAGITWDAIIPLEAFKVYKPHPRAYETVLDLFRVPPRDVLMVTANKDFGDLEAAEKLGMQAQLIRDGDGPKTITELAESMADAEAVLGKETT
jgi:2-haloalkanoic acid dehalogenase type II